MILLSLNPIKKFSGFMSQWIIPFLCTDSSLVMHWIAIWHISFIVKFLLWSRNKVYNVGPKRGSIKINESSSYNSNYQSSETIVKSIIDKITIIASNSINVKPFLFIFIYPHLTFLIQYNCNTLIFFMSILIIFFNRHIIKNVNKYYIIALLF